MYVFLHHYGAATACKDMYFCSDFDNKETTFRLPWQPHVVKAHSVTEIKGERVLAEPTR